MRLDEDPYFVFPSQPIDFGEGTQSLADAIALSQLVNAGFTPQPGNPLFDAVYDQAKQEAFKALKGNEIPAFDIKMADRDSWVTSVDVVFPLSRDLVNLTTAYEVSRGREGLVERGAVGLVQKPFEPEELIDIVRRNIPQEDSV